MPDTLLILGASTRAAAFSAIHGGWRPVCGDLFADVDLKRACPVTCVESYPDGLEQVAHEALPSPWMYTGALENYPELVDRLAADRELYGNSGHMLRRVRDPLLVAEALRAAGLPAIECRKSADGLPRDGTWLRKRRRSAAGMHVSRWRGDMPQETTPAAWYFQRFVPGMSCAAVYVSATGRSQLLGVTEQRLHDEFRYAGSLGPLPLDDDARAAFTRLGAVLAAEFGLVGVWGVDVVCNDTGIWPVEVNPRYTASMEVIERASGVSTVADHVAACRDGKLPSVPPFPSGRWHGKAIVSAPHDLLITAGAATRLDEHNQDATWPLVADLPAAGATIRRGHPICTVFVEGNSREDVTAALEACTREVLVLLFKV